MMGQEDLVRAADECLKERGYTPRLVPVILLREKTYQTKVPDGVRGRLDVEGTVLYRDHPEGAESAITWTGIYTPDEGLKVLAIDAMVAPAAMIQALSAPGGLRPRVTFRAGAKDPDDPEQVLEDLMPLLVSLENLVRTVVR